jgi:hypothetical protein
MGQGKHRNNTAVRRRRGLDCDTAKDDTWQDISTRSILPEDMQRVFMMVARAVKEGWPCPGDAAIAGAIARTRCAGRDAC